MRIAFCWTGGIEDKERFNHWNDGLRAAMRLIEAEHEVTYHEPSEDLPEVDWVLFWEAAITKTSDVRGASYNKILNSPYKKALLFAGGPVRREWFDGFDHVFVESQINENELNALGVRNSRAFGVNTDIFKPIESDKKFITVSHGTCASWKRQELAGYAFGEKALVFGKEQNGIDTRPFDECRKAGATVLLEQSYEDTNTLLNSAEVGLNCADMWGGGQRQTLEAMACNLPVVVMSDSPKNREFIEESSEGVICSPDPESIRNAVNTARQMKKVHARDYVMSKWTPEHYKNAILNVIRP